MLEEGAINRIDPQGDCWIWTGAITDRGYGTYRPKETGKTELAHRYVWKRLVGNLESPIDHRCRVKTCVNPDHLEPVTTAENNRRAYGTAGINFRKDRCINGHYFDETNTYYRKSGGRQCKLCVRIRKRK